MREERSVEAKGLWKSRALASISGKIEREGGRAERGTMNGEEWKGEEEGGSVMKGTNERKEGREGER